MKAFTASILAAFCALCSAAAAGSLTAAEPVAQKRPESFGAEKKSAPPPNFTAISLNSGKTELIACADNFILALDAETLEKKFALYDNIIGKINSACAAGDFIYLSGGNYCGGRIFRLNAKTRGLDTLKEFSDEVLSMSVSKDGELLAASCADGTLFALSLADGKTVFEGKISGAKVLSAAFTQNSQGLICACSDGKILLRNRGDSFSSDAKTIFFEYAPRQILPFGSKEAFCMISGYCDSAKFYVVDQFSNRHIKSAYLDDFSPAKIAPLQRRGLTICPQTGGSIILLRNSFADAKAAEFAPCPSPINDVCEAPNGVFSAGESGGIFFHSNSGELACGAQILSKESAPYFRWCADFICAGSPEAAESPEFLKIKAGGKAGASAEDITSKILYKTNFKRAQRESAKKRARKNPSKKNKNGKTLNDKSK